MPAISVYSDLCIVSDPPNQCLLVWGYVTTLSSLSLHSVGRATRRGNTQCDYYLGISLERERESNHEDLSSGDYFSA
jgi:hypothetical protein